MALELTQPLNRNEYQEYFLGGKGGWCIGLHLHVTIVFKSGNLSLLEPSGPVQACNRIALSLPLPLYKRLYDLSKYKILSSYNISQSIKWF
jgi:hypothetical protein